MKTTQSSVENATDDRSIESERLTRALTEPMGVTPVAPRQYDVTNDEGTTRTADVEAGTCQCGDYTHRGDRFVCKHVQRACIHHGFRRENNTRLVARVLRELRELGCPHDVRGCAGPTDEGPRGLPCEGCIAATPGHWVVYCRLSGHGEWLDAGATADRPVATDGGQDQDGDLDRGEGVMTDGGVASENADHGSPSDEVHERVVESRRERDRLKDRIESVAGERPAEVFNGRREVTARFEHVDEDMMGALSETFGVRTVGVARRESIEGGERTVTRYDVVYLEDVEVDQ